jgi:hypothetical protein
LHGEVYPHAPIGTLSIDQESSGRRSEFGPFLCICDTAYCGDFGTCKTCGYRIVHLMKPDLRDIAITRMPKLARQVVIA